MTSISTYVISLFNFMTKTLTDYSIATDYSISKTLLLLLFFFNEFFHDSLSEEEKEEVKT